VILSNTDIRDAISRKLILVAPEPPVENYATSALDLRLGNVFWRWREEAQGVILKVNCSEARIPDLEKYADPVLPDKAGRVAVPQHGFLLGMTLERIELPPSSRIAARVEGRSSLARLGLGVHITAPTIHAGFCGPIVLEFMNHGPHELVLTAGDTRVCQIIFERLSSDPSGNLDTVFQNQTGPFGKK
jgi:dCTP deaminase